MMDEGYNTKFAMEAQRWGQSNKGIELSKNFTDVIKVVINTDVID